VPGQPADSDSIGTRWPDGTSDPDHIPRHEPRLARAAALAYGLPGPPSGEQLLRISENWRPYRTWVMLLRTQLEDQTGEITGTPHTPGRRQQ
jgi:3-methyladenine DNA glycosylase/8-oxoguanine DNA glycosylase